MQHKVIPEMIDAKAGSAFPKRIRIWSAACSTGQERYSIAMVLHELIPDVHSWDITITATDVSDNAIKLASMGCYAPHEIQRGMKPELLAKYFTQQANGCKVKDELRGLIQFQRRNLLQPFGMLGPFDIILCRNVAIYFSPDVRRDLFLRLAGILSDGGYLFVGASESLTDLGPRIAPQHHCRSVYYRPNQATAARV